MAYFVGLKNMTRLLSLIEYSVSNSLAFRRAEGLRDTSSALL